MKTYPCENKTSCDSFGLSYEDIQKTEGIYKLYPERKKDVTRLIVVKIPNYFPENPTILYFHPEEGLQPPMLFWKELKFTKTDESLYLAIK